MERSEGMKADTAVLARAGAMVAMVLVILLLDCAAQEPPGKKEGRPPAGPSARFTYGPWRSCKIGV